MRLIQCVIEYSTRQSGQYIRISSTESYCLGYNNQTVWIWINNTLDNIYLHLDIAVAWIYNQLNGHQEPVHNSTTVVAAVGLLRTAREQKDGFPDADIGRQIETSKGLVPDTEQSGRGATQS